MSQNMRATPCDSPRHGSTWNVPGSGTASMSASCTRAKPSMADPSKPIPSPKALSSSAGAMATDFRNPSTSVNQSRTNLMSRSSIVRSTNSVCLSMAHILPHVDTAGSRCGSRSQAAPQAGGPEASDGSATSASTCVWVTSRGSAVSRNRFVMG